MTGVNETTSTAKQRISRRQLLGGVMAGGSVAAAYAVLGGHVPGPEQTWRGEEAITKESVRINHLLRRAGFGVTKAEYDHYQTIGLAATTAELLDFASVDDSEAEALAGEVDIDAQNRASAALRWVVLMANTKRPLQEKMTLFWHGLLTSRMSVVRSPEAMTAQNEFYRSHVFDSFPSVLRGITKDPAMMVFLDIAGSQREAPNENFARELMELFALGEGNYTEQDVREAARAFTGWQVTRTRLEGNGISLGEPAFRPNRFDAGSKTFLGRSGSFTPDDIIDIVTEQPASATHIVRRLFTFFVYPDPSDADLAPFIRVYEQNEMRIGPVVEAILRSEVFYSPRAYRALIKSPIEYAIGAIKALGLQAEIVDYTGAERIFGAALRGMGQVPFDPPSVAGWPGGAAWLNSATMLARLNFVNMLTGGINLPAGRQGSPAPRNTRQPADDWLDPALDNTDKLLEHYLPQLLDDNIPADARAILLEYGGAPETPLSPAKQRGLAYLVLASPQFHLS